MVYISIYTSIPIRLPEGDEEVVGVRVDNDGNHLVHDLAHY